MTLNDLICYSKNNSIDFNTEIIIVSEILV